MEVLFTAIGDTLNIDITTSVDNSTHRWNALFDRLNLINGLPAGTLIIHDFGDAGRRAHSHRTGF
jgi:malonate decarboxylase delta subunit